MDFGTGLFFAALAACVFIGWLVGYVLRIPWFRARFQSDDRWVRAQGMLPIALPVYLLVGLIFAYLR